MSYPPFLGYERIPRKQILSTHDRFRGWRGVGGQAVSNMPYHMTSSSREQSVSPLQDRRHTTSSGPEECQRLTVILTFRYLNPSRVVMREQVASIVHKDPMYSGAYTVLCQLMVRYRKATPHEFRSRADISEADARRALVRRH